MDGGLIGIEDEDLGRDHGKVMAILADPELRGWLETSGVQQLRLPRTPTRMIGQGSNL